MTLATDYWGVLFGTVFPILAIGIIIVVVLGLLVSSGALGLDKLLSVTTYKGRKPCCPPGLGCNDPITHQPCHRLQAQRVATVDELRDMDGAWAEFHGTSALRKHRRSRKLTTYERKRDLIVASAMRRAEEEMGGPKRPMLAMSGEVVDTTDDEETRPTGSTKTGPPIISYE